jgi:hypothetical protein
MMFERTVLRYEETKKGVLDRTTQCAVDLFQAVVRLVHRRRSGDYMNLDFECNQLVARTIDQKCKHILSSLGSAARQEYLEFDAGRKPGKRWFVDN